MSGPLEKVIVLGAGASVPAGAPTMRSFLDRARHLRRHSLTDERDMQAFDAVFGALRDLAGIHEKAYLDLNNLEEVFGAIEMAELVGKLADMPRDKIHELRNHFVRMVVRTLQLTAKVHSVDRTPVAAGTLARGIATAVDAGVGMTIVTFNYDLVMEVALRAAQLGCYYGLPEEVRPASKRVIPLLKLHGSVNWHYCDPCHVVYNANAFVHTFHPAQDRQLTVALNPPDAHKCNVVPDSTPIIVPPSWDKSRYQASLRPVWEHAAQALGRADEIYVIGYSLPEADAFFRYLFALGTQSHTRIQRLFVVNPDAEIKPKFDRFIGPGLKPQLQFADNGDFQLEVDGINRMLAET